MFDVLKSSLLLGCLLIAMVTKNVSAQYNTIITFNSSSDTIKYLSAEDIESITSTSTLSFKAVIAPNIETINAKAFSVGLLNNNILDSLIEVDGGNVKKVDINAFEYCWGLTKADFPNVDTLKMESFATCCALKEINLGSVRYIGHSVFANCVSLEKVYLSGDDLPVLGEGIFSHCHFKPGHIELIVSQAITNKYGYNTAMWPDSTWKMFYVYNPNPTWGPKIKLNLTNDAEQSINLFIGVDSLATDGYDSGIVFRYKDSELDTTLREDYDLPPAAPQTMTCRLVKDSLNPTSSYSYVDFRSISNSDKFLHRYWINIRWYSTQNPKINLHWGKLPIGIDSAKIRCREWMDNDDFHINMHEVEGLELDNESYKNLFINVWFNKNHIGIKYDKDNNLILYPNPTDNYVNLLSNDYTYYSIRNILGEELMIGKIEDNKINVVNLPQGVYILILNKNNNQSISIPFVRK